MGERRRHRFARLAGAKLTAWKTSAREKPLPSRRPAPPSLFPMSRPGSGGWSAADSTTRPGCGPHISACSVRPDCSISGTWPRPAGRTPTTRPPCWPGRKAGPPSSSDRSMPRTSSRSTRRRAPCGSWKLPRASSASTPGRCWRRKRSRVWRRWRSSSLLCGVGSDLPLALLAVIVTSGWWVAAVELIPSAARPYIGGSQNNDLLSLIFGYNGFGRLTGNESGSVGGFGALGSRWGLTGWNRLFNAQFGGQISWLIPAAIIFLGVTLLMTFRRPRTDIVRAAFLTWGGVLLLTGAVFSFAQGIIHPYYTVALAPAIGALVGMGAVFLWARRSEAIARLALAGSLATTAAWSFILLGRSPAFFPDLRLAVLVLGLLGATMI